MTALSDSFTDTDGTDLATHIADSGDLWVEHTSYLAGAHQIQANRARCSTAASAYYASGTRASADYDVEGVFRCLVTGNSRPGIAGRIDTAANTMYVVERNEAVAAGSRTWRLRKVLAGTITELGSYTVELVSSTSYTVKLEMRGSTIKVYVDGTERISVTDTDITAAGKAGVRATTATTATTSGVQLDSITATDASTTQTITTGIASETVSALTPTIAKAVAAGLPSETVSALTASAAKVIVTGLDTETDSTFAAAVAKGVESTIAAETDDALNSGATKIVLTGLAGETDTALAGAVAKAVLAGIASETDLALLSIAAKLIATGFAQETDSALPAVFPAQTILTGIALEHDSALRNPTHTFGHPSGRLLTTPAGSIARATTGQIERPRQIA